MRRVAVVGAGVSGLSFAHALVRHAGASGDVEVTVFEREARIGGVIRSERRDGYLCEHGPDGFLDRGDDVLTQIHELGLDVRLVPSNAQARRRFVYRRGRLRETPSGPGSFLAGDVLSLPGRLRALAEPLVRARPPDDETIHAFAQRRFGREAADVLVDAIASGVYGGDSRRLSLTACFPQLSAMEAEHGSIVRALAKRAHGASAGKKSGLGQLMSFREGIEELIRALGNEVGDRVRLRTTVAGLRRVPGGSGVEWELDCGAEARRFDSVVLANDASAAARIVEPLDARLSTQLREIPSAPLAVVCLGYRNQAARHTAHGFGFLVPRGVGPRILGAVWESNVFTGRAPDGHSLVRVMIGGATDPDALSLDDDALVRVARTDLEAICHLNEVPSFTMCIRQTRGLPQYNVGHVQRLSRIDERLSQLQGLILTGNSYRGVAVPACIAEARKLAATLGRPAAAAGAGPRV